MRGFHSDFTLITPDQTLSLADIRAMPSVTADEDKVAIRGTEPLSVAWALAALEGWAQTVHLLPTDIEVDRLEEGIAVIERPPMDAGLNASPPTTGRATRWVVYTSGTTGTPKKVEHTAQSLTRTIRQTERTRGLRWGLLYDTSRMAGLQVLLQAMTAGSTLAAPDLSWPLARRIAWMRQQGVTALSATPTLWRQILQIEQAGGWQLQQITLGGEIADQKILDALARQFPEARITHVFASTETGAAFGVNDRRAGFPVEYLREAPGGIRLRIVDDTLEVHNPTVSLAGDDGFVATGDIVRVEGDRVLFVGRDSGMVNVGGAKVWPEEVEAILRGHPDVEDAVVTARPNSFSGAILIASVVPGPQASPDLAKELRAWVRDHSPSHYVPAKVTVVNSLDVSSTGKAARR